MKFGICYFPEAWPEERWAIDAQMMKSAGLTYVRVGEFAWAKMEPADGHFEWDWLDQAIETLAAAGLKVVLGTPTATPPAWLIHAHPEILPVDAQGRQLKFGSRRHYCHANNVYHAYCARIVTEMASRYGHNPAVVGWQIDNELGCHDTARCYCEHSLAAFRAWLRQRYGSLEALNQAWGTVFWSQTYSDWNQIEFPNLTPSEPNPSQVLDFDRFSSDVTTAFMQLQVNLLRQHTQNQFITHNLMAEFVDVDYHTLAKPLDFICWDSYPVGYYERVSDKFYWPAETRPSLAYDVGDPYVTGFGHDLMRGMKQAPFWIMEHQPGHINWGDFNPGVRPGSVRLWSWHALASGAETVSFFRWRASLFGQEQYHAGLLKHDASPDIGLRELTGMAGEREQMDQISAIPHKADVAILFDYADLWALQIQPHRKEFSYLRYLFSYYRSLVQLGISVDIVSPQADLSGYRLLLAPTLHMVDQALVDRLQSYVEQGATLLIGVRSGFKTRSNIVTDLPLPGLLRSLTKATVSEWQALPPGHGYQIESAIPGLAGEACIWAEALEPETLPDGSTAAESLVTYIEPPYHGKSALIVSQQGAGTVAMIGWVPNLKQAQAVLLKLAPWLVEEALPHLPEGVIVVRRGPYLVIMNFGIDALSVNVQNRLVDLEPKAVKVFKI